MFTTKEYPCVCRVCGREHVVRADFLSASNSRIMPDGSERLVVNCDGSNKHSVEAVRAAWAAWAQ